jgi:hypothetical protein
MTSGIAQKTGLAGRTSFNPLAHLLPHRRRGQLLLRNVRRSLADPRTSATLHRLRDQVFFHQNGNGHVAGAKAIGFAGPKGHEGTTSIAVLFGLNLNGLQRNRALYVDGRLDRRSFTAFTEMFGLRPNPLAYTRSCGRFQCYDVGRTHLTLLAPVEDADSVEVFSSREFKRLLADLRETYDYILFDLPPILESSEARLVLPHLDLFFLVCAARRTTFAEVEKTKQTIAEVGGAIDGVVLNRQRFPFWASFVGRETFV